MAQHNDERLPLRQELSALPALTMPPLVVEEIARSLFGAIDHFLDRFTAA